MGPTATLESPTAAPTATPAKSRTRLGFLAVLLTGAFLLAACGMNADQQLAFDKVNASREYRSIPELAHDKTAQSKAQAWAEHLASSNKLAHSNLADGMDDGWTRLGENVGYGSSISVVHQKFMESPGHRENILSRGYTHLGVGVAQGNGRTYVVQVFVAR